MHLNNDSIELPTGSTLDVATSFSELAQNNRPTLLFLHFWGGSYNTWLYTISALGNDYDIIAPSLRGARNTSFARQGVGRTSNQDEQEKHYSMSQCAADMKALVNHFRAQNHIQHGLALVGHSMGGKIAQVLLTMSDLPIEKILLLSPAPATGFRLTEAMREQQLAAYETLENASIVVRDVLLGRGNQLDEGAVNALVDDAIAWSRDATKAWPTYGMSEDYADVVSQAVGRMKPEIVIMVGEQDVIEPPEHVRTSVVEFLAKAGADVKFKIIPGEVGHLIPVEVPELVAKAIKLLI